MSTHTRPPDDLNRPFVLCALICTTIDDRGIDGAVLDTRLSIEGPVEHDMWLAMRFMRAAGAALRGFELEVFQVQPDGRDASIFRGRIDMSGQLAAMDIRLPPDRLALGMHAFPIVADGRTLTIVPLQVRQRN